MYWVNAKMPVGSSGVKTSSTRYRSAAPRYLRPTVIRRVSIEIGRNLVRIYVKLRYDRLMNTAADAAVQSLLIGDAMEGAPAAVFVADDGHRFLAVNQFACDLLGYTRDDLLELRVDDLATTTDVEAGFERLRREGRLEGRVELRHREGSLVRLRYWASETTVSGISFWIAVAVPE
jgi:PAS domain S-box-containing protein